MSKAVEESGITIVPETTSLFVEDKKGNKLCEICHKKEWIYTCPRCLIHTCSLTCVRQHKKTTDCSGTRDKTAYIPLKKYTESHMMSDYTYLEDVSRQSDNITRSRLQANREVKIKSAEVKQRLFSKTVNQLGIRYSTLPIGMSRNKLNQSNYNKKLNSAFWSIEVHFCKNNKSKRYLEHSFPGTRTLNDFFDNLLFTESPQGKGEYQLIRYELSDFIEAGVDDFVIALKKEKSPRGHFVNVTGLLHTTLNDALKGETIIEFPIFYIWSKKEERPADVISMEEKMQLITVISQQDNNAEIQEEAGCSSSSSSEENNSSEGEDTDGNEEVKEQGDL